jgi:hypothetical protein
VLAVRRGLRYDVRLGDGGIRGRWSGDAGGPDRAEDEREQSDRETWCRMTTFLSAVAWWSG